MTFLSVGHRESLSNYHQSILDFTANQTWTLKASETLPMFDYGIHICAETGRWEEIFNSQAPQYDGWNDSGNYGSDLRVQGDEKLHINLPKWAVLIFSKQ